MAPLMDGDGTQKGKNLAQRDLNSTLTEQRIRQSPILCFFFVS
jgi:hypothetical protein